MRQRQLIGGITLVAVLSAVAGWAASTVMQSPQQALAETAAPRKTTLYAAVESRQVRQSVLLRGQVVPARAQPITLPLPEEGRAVVTRLPMKAGQSADTGSVVLEVSGRPVVTLTGATPAYRDLRPGSSGPDVEQLQEALREAGVYGGPTDGVLGPSTKAAIGRFYDSLGYEAPTTGEDAELQAEEAGKAAVEARRAEEDARLAFNSTPPQGRSAAKRLLERAVEDRKSAQKLADRLEGMAGEMVPLSEYVFVPELPATISTIGSRVGSAPASPALSLATGGTVVTTVVDAARVKLLRKGQSATLTSDVGAAPVEAKVATIGAVTKADDGSYGHPVTLQPAAALDVKTFGSSVGVDIASASSEGEVLAVPVSAIYTGSNGQTAVDKKSGGGSVTVPVRTGTTGDGFVEITALSGRLEAGDEVVVGVR